MTGIYLKCDNILWFYRNKLRHISDHNNHLDRVDVSPFDCFKQEFQRKMFMLTEKFCFSDWNNGDFYFCSLQLFWLFFEILQIVNFFFYRTYFNPNFNVTKVINIPNDFYFSSKIKLNQIKWFAKYQRQWLNCQTFSQWKLIASTSFTKKIRHNESNRIAPNDSLTVDFSLFY